MLIYHSCQYSKKQPYKLTFDDLGSFIRAMGPAVAPLASFFIKNWPYATD